ncbi:MAG: dolichyl-phosphate beta-glucosyltransferase [Planctomycetota bacterium]
MKLLSIIIPAFNEEERLPATLLAADEFVVAQDWDVEILVVDDGSADRTVEVAEQLAPELTTPLTVLRCEHRGKGGATAAGMLAATGAYRFLCDADLAMPFVELPRFLELARTGVGVVIGSREAPGARRENEPWHRHYMGRIFNILVRFLAVPYIQDTQCGYKLFRDDVAREVFSRVTIPGFAFDVEALYLARALGHEIRELPILWRHHPDSRVHALRHSFEMFLAVLGVRWRAMRGQYNLSVRMHDRR